MKNQKCQRYVGKGNSPIRKILWMEIKPCKMNYGIRLLHILINMGYGKVPYLHIWEFLRSICLIGYIRGMILITEEFRWLEVSWTANFINGNFCIMQLLWKYSKKDWISYYEGTRGLDRIVEDYSQRQILCAKAEHAVALRCSFHINPFLFSAGMACQSPSRYSHRCGKAWPQQHSVPCGLQKGPCGAEIPLIGWW